MIARILLGLIFVFIGLVVVYYSSQLVRVFGNNKWADMNLGGTRQMYVLIGFFLIVFGFLLMFGLVDFGAGTNVDGTGF